MKKFISLLAAAAIISSSAAAFATDFNRTVNADVTLDVQGKEYLTYGKSATESGTFDVVATIDMQDVAEQWASLTGDNSNIYNKATVSLNLNLEINVDDQAAGNKIGSAELTGAAKDLFALTGSGSNGQYKGTVALAATATNEALNTYFKNVTAGKADPIQLTIKGNTVDRTAEKSFTVSGSLKGSVAVGYNGKTLEVAVDESIDSAEVIRVVDCVIDKTTGTITVALADSDQAKSRIMAIKDKDGLLLDVDLDATYENGLYTATFKSIPAEAEDIEMFVWGDAQKAIGINKGDWTIK